jgi:hypothetical protein
VSLGDVRSIKLLPSVSRHIQLGDMWFKLPDFKAEASDSSFQPVPVVSPVKSTQCSFAAGSVHDPVTNAATIQYAQNTQFKSNTVSVYRRCRGDRQTSARTWRDDPSVDDSAHSQDVLPSKEGSAGGEQIGRMVQQHPVGHQHHRAFSDLSCPNPHPAVSPHRHPD